MLYSAYSIIVRFIGFLHSHRPCDYCIAELYGKLWHRKVQYSKVQYTAVAYMPSVQYSTVRTGLNTELFIPHSNTLYSIVQFSTVL